MKSFFRFLGRNKLYSLINVTGFVFSMAFVILTAAYTWHESTVDRFHKDAGRIYLLMNRTCDGWWEEGDAFPVAGWYKETFPDVEDVCAVSVCDDVISVVSPDWRQEKVQDAVTLFCMDNFFIFFSYPLLEGTPETVLGDPYAAVVSESFADKMFGDADPLGKPLKISDSTVVTIRGVMKDFNRTMLPDADLILRVERLPEFNRNFSMEGLNSSSSSITYIKAAPGIDMNIHREDALKMYSRNAYWIFNAADFPFANTDVRFVRLDEAYFFNNGQYSSILDSDTDANEFAGRYSLHFGDRNLVQLLWILVVLVMVFSLFNYINLSVIQAGFRYKESATRRLVGASRLSVYTRLMAESLCMASLSFVLALSLALALRPYAEGLLQSEIDLSVLMSPGGIAVCVLLVLFVSFMSGMLPSYIVASVRPIEMVNGTSRYLLKKTIGDIFLGVQIAVTFVLLSLAFVTGRQIYSMCNAPLGYETADILYADCFIPVVFEKGGKEAFCSAAEAIASIPGVSRVGVATSLPTAGRNSIMDEYNHRSMAADWVEVDSTAFSIMGFNVLRDNGTDVGGACFLSRGGYEAMGLPIDASYVDVGDEYSSYSETVVLRGMIEDIRQTNILSVPEPTFVSVYNHWDETYSPFTTIVVEVSGDHAEVCNSVNRVLDDNFSGNSDVEAAFLNDKVHDSFIQQFRLNKILVCFAVVALVISVIGLVAMSLFYMRQRSHDISIRKVFGADNRQSFIYLVSPFMLYSVIGIAAGCPLAWYLTDAWLSGFSYRVSGIGWYMLATAIFCLAVSYAAVSIQGRIVSRVNPVDNIRM